MALVSINPTTGETLHRFLEHSRDHVDQRVERSSEAFRGWRELAPSARARKLRALASIVKSERDALAALITSEMGKPISQARAEVDKCAACCTYYAQHGPKFLADERPPGAPEEGKVVF